MQPIRYHPEKKEKRLKTIGRILLILVLLAACARVDITDPKNFKYFEGTLVDLHKKILVVKSDDGQKINFRVGRRTIFIPKAWPNIGDGLSVRYHTRVLWHEAIGDYFIAYMVKETKGISVPIELNPGVLTHGKTYYIGLVEVVNTGSTMITVYNLWLWPSYTIQYEYKPPEGPMLTPGQEWVAYHILGDNYIVTSKNYKFGIEIKPNGELGQEKPWIEIKNKMRRLRQRKWKVPDSQLFMRLEGYPVKEKEGSFKAELIYSGITKNTIHITYREFVDNLARPAFYQELRYDLNESDLITFRSLKIKVLEANNARIKFQVIDDAGLPWMPIK